MPYLDLDWMVGTTPLPAGTWVPERNWDRWQTRAKNAPGEELKWRLDPENWTLPTAGAPDSPEDNLSERALSILAGDIVSAQRDALIYSNLIDRLKDSPSDATADEVVDEMLTLGLASAGWPEAVGGPPPHQSPRPWRAVLYWLIKLAAKATKFLFTGVESVGATFATMGISAFAVEISLVPKVSIEIPTEIFRQDEQWRKAKQFLSGMISELGEKVFSV
jgi:hypothetical protein